MNHSSMLQLLYYLVGMIVAVPLFKKLGLGSVLAYLVVGIILGSQVTGLIDESQATVGHLAEFGVIVMLMLIGLEINPKLLWSLRGPIFGIGGAQVLLLGLIGAIILAMTSLTWQGAVAIGLILSLSSTAIVLQTLQEKGLEKSKPGKLSFAVLIMQDIAVIPLIALLPVLAGTQTQTMSSADAWRKAFTVLLAVAIVIASGRFLLRPFFRAAARLNLRETFTAIAVLLVVGTTALMQMAGLSPALGAFLAGVVLADSEYRHQIETDLEPFKGLLLGVFFISVGAGIDVHQIMASPLQIALTVLAFVLIKTLLGIGLGRVAKLCSSDAVLFGVSLAQGSEFAFVVLALAGQVGLITAQQQQGWTSVVAMSMALAPLLIAGTIKFVLPRLAPLTPDEAPRQPDTPQEVDNHIIVVGMGRFGQIIVRLLRANGFSTTVLDHDAEQIEVMNRFGYKAYFGDARNYDLLRAAGIERARGVVLAVDNAESTTLILQSIREHHRDLPLYVRAYDRVHAYKLLHEGATEVAIETGGSALNLGVKVLENLGYERLRAFRQARLFQNHTDSNIRELAQLYHETDEKSFFLQARERIFLLENILAQEAGLKKIDDHSWESPPRTT